MKIAALQTVSGVQQQGGWRPEAGTYNSFQLQSSALDAPVRRHSGLRSTWNETPWAALTGRQPGGILAALEYGGQWEMRAGQSATTDAVTLGFAPDGIQPRVQAGERWVSPAGWIGLFPDDLDSALGDPSEGLLAAHAQVIAAPPAAWLKRTDLKGFERLEV